MKRIDFIKNISLISASGFIAPELLLSCTSSKKEHPLVSKIGIQLYSVKEKYFESAEKTIATIAQAGFKNIETFGWGKDNTLLGKPLKDFIQMLKNEGLSSHSGHYLVDELIYDVNWDIWKTAINDSLALGQEYFIIPWMDTQKIAEKGGITHLVDTLTKAADLCKQSGIRLAYHNHAFEFQEKFEDKIWMDWLIEKTDPSNFFLQTDIFWVNRAGVDPKSFLKQHADRIKLWHVKDNSKANDGTTVALGEGTIPYHEILAIPFNDKLDYPVYEQEHGLLGEDFGATLKKSYTFMKENIQ